MRNPSDLLKIRKSILYNKYVNKDIKIASVGDTHLSSLVGMEDVNKLSEVLYESNPDYICVLGDIVDTPKELLKDEKIKELKTLMNNSSSIAPTMVILGSHDFIDEELAGFPDVMKKTPIWDEINGMPNVHLLNDEVYDDDKIFFGGYRQKWEAYYNLLSEHKEDSEAYYEEFKKHENLYKDLPEEKPRILLTHSPESIIDPKVENLLKEYNVILTGHYHDGCVPAMLDKVFPKNAGLITPRRSLFPRKARGIVKLNSGTYLVYSGGWTKMAACVPSVLYPLDKLCNRQIDITTLTSNEEYINEEIEEKKLVLKR